MFFLVQALLVVGWFFVISKLKRLRWGLRFILSFTFISYAYFVPFFADLLRLRNVLFLGGGILAFASIHHLARGRLREIGLLVGLYISISAMSGFSGVNPIESVLRFVGLTCMVLIALYVALPTRRGQTLAIPIAQVLIFLGLVQLAMVALFIAENGLSFSSRLSFSDVLKATGSGSYAVMAGIAAAALSIGSRTRRYKRLFFSVFFVGFLGAFSTGTRMAILQYILVMPLVLVPRYFQKGFSTRVVSAVFVAALVVGLTFEAVRDDLSEGQTSDWVSFLRLDREDVADTRRELWEDALDKSLERWVLGRGLGSSSFYVYSDDYIKGLSFSEFRALGRVTVHNQFVEVFYETGIFGLTLFCLFLTAVALRALRWLAFGMRECNAVAVYLPLIWLAYVAGMVTHGGITTTGNSSAIVFWIISFLLASQGPQVSAQQGVLSPFFQRRLGQR